MTLRSLYRLSSRVRCPIDLDFPLLLWRLLVCGSEEDDALVKMAQQNGAGPEPPAPRSAWLNEAMAEEVSPGLLPAPCVHTPRAHTHTHAR
jgi:hypothetical protein